MRAPEWPWAACIALACLASSVPLARAEGAGRLDIRVMTFNIRYGTAPDGPDAWDNRKGLVLQTIKESDPDVLGVQECLRFQAEYLAEHLEGYEFVGVGRDDGRDAGEMCAVFYRADRFQEVDHGHFWLSETPEVVGSRGWDAALPRMATWLALRARADTLASFVVVNTHFDHAGEEARLESSRLLGRRARALRGDLPAIVMGDFNAPADSTSGRPYAELVSGADDSARALIDAYRDAHPEPEADEGTFNAFRGLVDGARVDWILVTPGVEVLESDIDRRHRRGSYPSDHFPVSAVVRIPDRSRE